MIRHRIRKIGIQIAITLVSLGTAGSLLATEHCALTDRTAAMGESVTPVRDESVQHRDADPVQGRFDVTDPHRHLREGWPVNLAAPGSGFPYTPTLFDVDGDGADEIFLTGGHTFALEGDGSFMPGWPTTEMLYMGYGTNGNKPGPSIADLEGDGDFEILWTERDWWAGSSIMWTFNAKNVDATNLPSFPQQAPDQTSNALDTPFVLADTDGDDDLEAWGAHTLGNTGTHYRVSALDHLGNLLFTTDLEPNENVLSLYFGDVDGDGSSEVFAVSWLDPSFRLHVFAADGSEQPGYPIVLETLSSGYLMFGPPIPVDLDDDGDLEILLGYNAGGASRASCRHHDGALVTGFPFQIATSSQLFYLGLGDVTGDAEPELIALDNHLGGNYRVHVLDLGTGTPLLGWPFGVPDWPKGFPTVVDIDDDGLQEISFVTGGGELYSVNGDGTLVTGFPLAMVSPSISGVAAGDIDDDGLYELVAATWDGWVYAWETPSVVLPGRADWPMRGIDARNTGVFAPDQGSTGLAATGQAPAGLRLMQNTPNPFLGSTRIQYTLSRSSDVELAVFDCAGRLVRILARHAATAAGSHSVAWDGRNAAGRQLGSGIYFYRLTTADGTVTREMLQLK